MHAAQSTGMPSKDNKPGFTVVEPLIPQIISPVSENLQSQHKSQHNQLVPGRDC